MEQFLPWQSMRGAKSHSPEIRMAKEPNCPGNKVKLDDFMENFETNNSRYEFHLQDVYVTSPSDLELSRSLSLHKQCQNCYYHALNKQGWLNW